MKPQTQMQVGLGEALERHNLLHKQITVGIATPEQRSEYKLLSTALNEIKLNLGFDCDDDGVPDTIEIFHATAQTSCCRFLPSPPKRKRGRPLGSKNKKTLEKTKNTPKTSASRKSSTKTPKVTKKTLTAKSRRKK